MCPANGRRRYNVTSSPIGWAHTQNDPWRLFTMPVNHEARVDKTAPLICSVLEAMIAMELTPWRILHKLRISPHSLLEQGIDIHFRTIDNNRLFALTTSRLFITFVHSSYGFVVWVGKKVLETVEATLSNTSSVPLYPVIDRCTRDGGAVKIRLHIDGVVTRYILFASNIIGQSVTHGGK